MAEVIGKDATQPPQQQSDLPGVARLNGVNYPWMVTQGSLDALKDYDVWEDDVWVTTYPKAGTHWVLEIVNLVLVEGNEEKINRSQQSMPVEFDPFQPGRRKLPMPSPMPSPVPQYKAMKEWQAPRAIMTHMREELMPAQIYQGKGKVVYVIRNPKDITVSNWNFMKQLGFDRRYADWDFFVKESFTEDILYGSWFTHVLDFWNKHQHDKNFLFIKYEDMKQDAKGAVIQIADFLGKPLSEEAINRVVDFSSLQSMKKRFNNATSKGGPPFKEGAPSKEGAPFKEGAPSKEGPKLPSSEKKAIGAPSIIRKGVVGDWKSKFTVAQSEAVDALYTERMAGSSLTVQF